jgi:flagellar motor switch protein FliN/FliY
MAKTAQATKEKAKEKPNQQADTSQDDARKQAQSVELSEVAGTEAAGAPSSFDILLEMNVPVVAVIGKTEMPVRRLLQLGPGSVLKLDKSVDAPLDLYLRDTKFASGNVVVVEDRFAVRIEQIHGIENSASNAPEA